MKVESCLINVRCDGRSCHNLATTSLHTDSRNGCINFCENCFDALVKEIKEFTKKHNKQIGDKTSENGNKKRKY